MALDAASYPLLWELSDATGLRPEYVIPVLQRESGLNPAARNKYGYSGLNQISQKYLAAHGIDINDYVTWPASEQLRRVVIPFLTSLVAQLGAIRSGTRLYQANFLPATLRTAQGWDDAVSTRGDAYYAANSGLDADHDGAIQVRDLGAAVASGAAAAAASIDAAYSLRPSESRRDSVRGEDFGGGSDASAPGTTSITPELLAALMITASAIGVAWYIRENPGTVRWLRPLLGAR